MPVPASHRPRVFWSCAALLASVVATLAADRPYAPAARTAAPLVPVTCWSENFDAVTAPALPLVWKSVTLSGASNPWATVAAGADTAPNRAAIGNPATVSDTALSAMVSFPSGAGTLTFRHAFDTEAGFDGGVLEIAYDSTLGVGSFADIVAAGGSFVAGGYTAALSGAFGNPIGGRQAWSGNSGGFITTTVNLPAGAAGRSGRLRWRLATDLSSGAGGWSLDTVSIAGDPCATGSTPGAFSKMTPEHWVNQPSTPPVLQPTNATLTWAPSPGAAGYQYCVHTSSDNSCDPWINVGLATSVTVNGLAPSTSHYWHVKALDPNGGPSRYSNGSQTAFWRFLTMPDPPGAFTKISPLSGATNRPATLTLNWSPSAGATAYEYCLDKTDNGACGSVWEPAGNALSVTLRNLDAATLHSWHVRAINGAGATYADASTAAFTAFTTAPASRIPLIDFDGNGTGDVFLQELATGQWVWQRYQAGGVFIESAGNQGPDSSTTPMLNSENVDARTDGTTFNAVTGLWELRLSNGTTFSGISGSGIWWQGWQRHVMDLNGDGISDFFLYDPATGVWFQCVMGLPEGPRAQCYQGGWNPGWEVYPLRLNNDKFSDLFIIDRNTGRWFWALGTGPDSWNFTYPVTETWFSGWNIHPGDFNGDGLSDLLLHDPGTGTYFVAFSTGSGFTYASGGWAPAWKPIVADLDGDGKDDVFRHDPATGNWSPTISNGAGGFTKVGTGTWSLGWQIHPTDFDGDGKADFLLYHPGTGVWYQARNTGPGAFALVSGTWKPGLKISTGAIGR